MKAYNLLIELTGTVEVDQNYLIFVLFWQIFNTLLLIAIIVIIVKVIYSWFKNHQALMLIDMSVQFSDNDEVP